MSKKIGFDPEEEGDQIPDPVVGDIEFNPSSEQEKWYALHEVGIALCKTAVVIAAMWFVTRIIEAIVQ